MHENLSSDVSYLIFTNSFNFLFNLKNFIDKILFLTQFLRTGCIDLHAQLLGSTHDVSSIYNKRDVNF